MNEARIAAYCRVGAMRDVSGPLHRHQPVGRDPPDQLSGRCRLQLGTLYPRGYQKRHIRSRQPIDIDRARIPTVSQVVRHRGRVGFHQLVELLGELVPCARTHDNILDEVLRGFPVSSGGDQLLDMAGQGHLVVHHLDQMGIAAISQQSEWAGLMDRRALDEIRTRRDQVEYDVAAGGVPDGVDRPGSGSSMMEAR